MTGCPEGWTQIRIPAEMWQKVRDARKSAIVTGKVIIIDDGEPNITVCCENDTDAAHISVSV